MLLAGTIPMHHGRGPASKWRAELRDPATDGIIGCGCEVTTLPEPIG